MHSLLILGCGSIGERHLRCFQRTGRAQVTGCDTSAPLIERIAQQYHVPVFTDLQAALAGGRYDGIVLCTPAHTHLDLALVGLAHGAGLLIEKPLDVTLAKVPAVRAAIAQAEKFVAVAYVFHFLPAIRAARQVVRSGELGGPLHISVITGHDFPAARPAYREIYYARHEMGGGAIQDGLTHLVNAIEWIVGPTTRLFCDAAHLALEGVSVEDTVNVVARHGGEGGPMTAYALNQFQAPTEVGLQIHCERGSVKIEPLAQRWGIFLRGASEWEWRQLPVLERDDWFTAQAEAFLDGLEGKPTDLCTFDEAVQTLKFNLAALESMRSGASVTLA